LMATWGTIVGTVSYCSICLLEGVMRPATLRKGDSEKEVAVSPPSVIFRAHEKRASRNTRRHRAGSRDGLRIRPCPCDLTSGADPRLPKINHRDSWSTSVFFSLVARYRSLQKVIGTVGVHSQSAFGRANIPDFSE
jgi:hypothetical protein